MKEINVSVVTNTVKELCLKANCFLNNDMKQALMNAKEREISQTGKSILNQLLENLNIAEQENIAICQDTGITVVFIEVGQDVHFIGGNLEDAINEGVRQGYSEGYFRKSIVKDPINRVNTGDNTPAVIYYSIIPGDRVKIEIAPKGIGSENMSRVGMLKPSDGIEGIINFVVETVEKAGPNACPPIVAGVGIGGTMEKAALLAKEALLRPSDESNPRKDLAELEERILERINKLGIGPMGLGGKVTALKVNIETYPTHIGGLPVAVNLSCHALRHAAAMI